jgi:hypothetical protein
MRASASQRVIVSLPLFASTTTVSFAILRKRPRALSVRGFDRHRSVRHTGLLVLALHDPVRNDRRTGGVSVSQPELHVWGAGLFVMPLTLIYTAVVYRLFRGKVVEVDHG